MTDTPSSVSSAPDPAPSVSLTPDAQRARKMSYTGAQRTPDVDAALDALDEAEEAFRDDRPRDARNFVADAVEYLTMGRNDG